VLPEAERLSCGALEAGDRDGERLTFGQGGCGGKGEGGQHVAPRGSECRASQPVLEPGQTITPVAIAVAASFGLNSLRVIPRPSMAVITTGAELISLDEDPRPGQIRDSNGPMLVTMARDMALEPPAHLHAEDRLEAILEALAEVAGRQIVLLTGGVSVGTYDLVPQALERYGAEVVFHKVSQKPGKPLLFGRKGPQLIFGLPGNPLACHFCFHRYVAAAIRCTEGKHPVADPVLGELARPVQPKRGRTYFVAALARRRVEAEPNWMVHPLPGTSSADVFSSAGANCYAELPPGKTPIPAGEAIRFTWIGDAPWPN
ncbi:MAG: molybdopterin molybdotransferase MoeA, partial [Planctomycetes bacterium]|nr:molybdopterin molybdotransferase MoeA [Planctomycetota bacterium]